MTSGAKDRNTAATPVPTMDVGPEIATPTSRLSERKTVKLSGETKLVRAVLSAPAAPTVAALTPKAMAFQRRTSTPTAVAAVGWSRSEIQARPVGPQTRRCSAE